MQLGKMEQTPQSITTDGTTVVLDVHKAPAAIRVEASVEKERGMEDQPPLQTPLQTLMKAAAQVEEPVRSCGPFVAPFGFEGEVDDAYQAWLALSKVWGCLAVSVISLAMVAVVSLRVVRGDALMNTKAATFMVCIVLGGVAALPCLAAPFFHQITSRAVAHRGTLQWFAEGLCTVTSLYTAVGMINTLHESDYEARTTEDAANLYLLCGLGAVLTPTLSLVMLKVAVWQPLAWGTVYLVLLASSSLCNTVQILVPYFLVFNIGILWVDQTSRRQFLSELQIVAADRKLLALTLHGAKLLQAAKEADETANTAINHCGKRVMYNNLQWVDNVDTKVLPDLDSGEPARIAKAAANLKVIALTMKAENKKGFDKCKTVIALKQIAAHTYVPISESIHTGKWLREKTDVPNLTVRVGDDVPEYVCLPKVTTEIILDNATSNAITHGKQDGQITMDVENVDGEFLLISLRNEPGPRHQAARDMQQEHGNNAILNDRDGLDMASIAAASSTLCGGNEMTSAAKAGEQEISLVFDPDAVVFTLRMKLVHGTAAETLSNNAVTLKPSAVMICADDDKASRMSYKPLARKLGVGQDRLTVLGETYEEAQGLKETVLEAAQEHGSDNLVCIFDQNMDNYRCKRKVLGTDVARELRVAGYKGVVLIRSANDDFASVLSYRQAGADGALSKLGNVRVLAEEVVRQCNLAWEMGVCNGEPGT